METSPAVRTPVLSAEKRQAMMDAAAHLFLQKGFSGTSLDDIAADAGVSKQTVYKHFTDKDQLFREIVLHVTERAQLFVDELVSRPSTGDLEADLRELAHRHLAAVVQPEVLQLRRLVIGEADRFPDLAHAYYERGPGLVLSALAARFRDLGEQGLLRVDDPDLAANHFAWLVLAVPLDRSMFYGPSPTLTDEELRRYGNEAVRVFLSAYGQVRRRQNRATRASPAPPA